MTASKLLFISHNRDRLHALQKSLAPLANDALFAENASLAVDLCRTENISAILMDFDPNAAEAMATTAEIRESGDVRETPIVYLNDASPETLRRKLEAYTSEMLSTPALAELQRSVGELTRANEALHDFTWAASHDLKEPIRGIVTLAERLIRSAESKLDPNEREWLHLIGENATRTIRLIEAMQQYVYVGEAGHQSWGRVDLDTVLHSVVSQLKGLIRQHAATVSWEALPVLCSNEVLLTHVFQNLISNAVKYHSAAPPKVRVCAERRADRWIFSVEDNGIGIEPVYRECVFEPFKRLQSKSMSGSGIGLAICRSAVRRLGGSIWVEPREPNGSIFRFTLPDSRDHAGEHPISEDVNLVA